MKGSKIYKRLSGGAKYPVGDAIWYCVLGFFAFSFIAVPVWAATDFAGWGMLIAIAAGALAAFIFAKLIAAKRLGRIKRRIDARRRKLDGISETQWQRLDDEVASAEFFFKTFYLLEDYLYIPKPRLIVRYTDIKAFRTVQHSTNGINDAVYIDLTDREGNCFRFYVKKWREYMDFRFMFLDKLQEKIDSAAERS